MFYRGRTILLVVSGLIFGPVSKSLSPNILTFSDPKIIQDLKPMEKQLIYRYLVHPSLRACLHNVLIFSSEYPFHPTDVV